MSQLSTIPIERLRSSTSKLVSSYRSGKISLDELADNVCRPLMLSDDESMNEVIRSLDRDLIPGVLKRFEESVAASGYRPSVDGLVHDSNDRNAVQRLQEELEPKYRRLHAILCSIESKR